MRHGLGWYWHRLRAMGGGEVRQRILQKWHQRQDARRPPDFRQPVVGVPAAGAWPPLPDLTTVPTALVQALHHDADELLAGRWRLFGHLQARLDSPPRWFMDAVAGREVPTGRPGFRLNHRELPRGCDIKVLWEPSRWAALVRLAQAGWVAGRSDAREACVRWLDDWVKSNPPYYGWNWTSGLEAGMRLLNFSWIDALLAAQGVDAGTLARLRQRILPAHVWFTARHGSIGSSANNHLLGEQAGLLAALARWPELSVWGGSIETLHAAWEREVLAQFAPDGGNREQALNYQLYAWELCWAARGALRSAGRTVAPAVEERLRRAADFFVTVQVPQDPWDYGDSDSATATPFFLSETDATGEWYRWLAEPDPTASPALRWWLGAPPEPMPQPACAPQAGEWLVFPDSGQAAAWTDGWHLRWDLSPLGYLSTAAHGHLDALHLSIWLDGVAVVVDPGTGAYYGDTRLRAWLASWPAHNGPHLEGEDFPPRLGPFLWGEHHERPTWQDVDGQTFAATLNLPAGRVRRRVRRVKGPAGDGWQVEDDAQEAGRETGKPFRVCWQFPPGTRLEADRGNLRFYHGERRGVRFTVGLDSAWSSVELLPETTGSLGFPVSGDLPGLCSSAFRRVEAGPVLVVSGRGGNPLWYRTTFLREA